MTLIAYHNDQSIKDAILLQLQRHYDADQIIKGLYWQEGKGCAVGCTIHSSDHMDYERLFGIPAALARLEDTIFEGLPNDVAKDWPIQFMTAIQPGMDLSLVSWKFLHWLLTDEEVNPGINHPLVKDAVAQAAQVILAISKGEPPDIEAARAAAVAAAEALELAAHIRMSDMLIEPIEGPVRLAEAAWFAADSARARSARSAAMSTRSAAKSAAILAKLVGSAGSAYARMADKLIELIEAAPTANTTTQEPKP